MNVNRELRLGQTELVIQWLRDLANRTAIKDWPKMDWILKEIQVIEKEHSKAIFNARLSMNGRWIESWIIQGSGTKAYKVSRDRNGEFGCSCPAWTNEKGTKTDCKHILKLKLSMAEAKTRVSKVDRYVPYPTTNTPAPTQREEPKVKHGKRVIRFED